MTIGDGLRFRTARWAGTFALAGSLWACGGGGYGGGGSGGPAYNGGPISPPPPAVSAFSITNLVSDSIVVPAAQHDGSLRNAWGLAFGTTGFGWVVDNGPSRSTLYDGDGALQLAVAVGDMPDTRPTGVVFNGTGDFRIVVANNANVTTPFIMAGENGTISSWSPMLDANRAFTVFDGSADGAVYEGLAIGRTATANLLYATDFHNGVVNVINGDYVRVNAPGRFSNPQLPTGFSPFGIQAVGEFIVVTYALPVVRGSAEVDAGAGKGVVAVFDTQGNFLRQLAVGGALNAPWGVALAPANFGTFAGKLLVANFGDGRINAFDFATGAPAGALANADGSPIIIDGLRGIAFGNGQFHEPGNTLFFTAGPGAGTHGLYGRIDLR